ncbi:MAG: alpha/beta fold hydrolase [Alphaproteobacteria bacterium]|nr:alpha/beta fold hydrolase [Alphaproteobacteria bacterium]
MIEGAHERRLIVRDLSFTAHDCGEGPAVLCLHGFPDTPATFTGVLPALADAGFRAIAVTCRGYEPASQPRDGAYHMRALAGDVADWMDALELEQAHLVGHDWGASIACAAAALAPARVRSLTMLAVPHPASFAAAMMSDHAQLKRSWYIFIFQVPGLAEQLIRAGDDMAFLERLWRDWSPDWRWSQTHVRALKSAFAQPGVIEAALSYYRAAFNANAPGALESAQLMSAPIPAPTLGVTGDRDGCVSADVFARAMPAGIFTGGVEIVRAPHAGHFLHLEAPDLVHAAIIAHLKAHS